MIEEPIGYTLDLLVLAKRIWSVNEEVFDNRLLCSIFEWIQFHENCVDFASEQHKLEVI